MSNQNMNKQEKNILLELSERTDELVRFCRIHRIPVYICTEPNGTIPSAVRSVRYITPDDVSLCMSNDNVTKLALMGNQNLRLSPIKTYQNERKKITDDALSDFMDAD